MIAKIGRLAVTALCVVALSGCGSIISRTVAGQGQGHQYYPGVRWDVRDTPWRFLTIIDLPLSLVADTLLLPVDMKHGPYE
ncbi:YceK/YidQ family lipoprotein [Erwinia sp. V71]|uniref:YceK/YidQ family lipoprotein n=1 Tax=Erwinia sp. V71 TaxID=3369424 RepID=UPI003F5F4FD2